MINSSKYLFTALSTALLYTACGNPLPELDQAKDERAKQEQTDLLNQEDGRYLFSTNAELKGWTWDHPDFKNKKNVEGCDDCQPESPKAVERTCPYGTPDTRACIEQACEEILQSLQGYQCAAPAQDACVSLDGTPGTCLHYETIVSPWCATIRHDDNKKNGTIKVYQTPACYYTCDTRAKPADEELNLETVPAGL